MVTDLPVSQPRVDTSTPIAFAPLQLLRLETQPLVSILMPSYNYAGYIGTAIESVLAQTYSRFELIVCDDGSTDHSCDIVRKYMSEDLRIQLIKQPNGGVASALNAAYAASSGEVICLLDADDMFAPNKLEAVVEAFREHRETGFVLHGMEVVDGEGDRLYALPASGSFEEGWIADRVARRGGRWRSMPASALCFRRAVADVLFPMPVETLRSLADGYLFMLAPLLTHVTFVQQRLAEYRLHGANLTGSLQFDRKVAEAYVSGMERVHASIASRVCPDLFDRMPLQLTDHLTYHEQSFLKALFEDTGRIDLARAYLDLLRRIQADDLYGMPRKLAGAIANGVAIGLPVQWRPGWITWSLGARWRSVLRKLAF